MGFTPEQKVRSFHEFNGRIRKFPHVLIRSFPKIKLGGLKTTLITRNMLLLVLSSILFYSSMYIILNYLPGFVSDLGGTELDIGLVTGVLVFSCLIMRPIVGWIIDRLGRKPVLLVGNVFFIVAPFFYLFPTSVAGLIPARVLHGVGLSLFTTAGLTIVIDLADSSQWGEATGMFLSAQLLAISLAPALGTLVAGDGSLVVIIPWAIGLALLSFISAIFIRTPINPNNTPIYHLDNRGHLSKLSSPVIAAVTMGIGYAAVITFLPLIAMGNGMHSASLFYFLYALVAIIVRTPAGRLSDRIGRSKLIIPSMLLSGLGLFIVSFSTSAYCIGFAALVYGLGFGAAYPVIGAMVADYSPRKSRGLAFGIYAGGFDLGLITGSIVGGIMGASLGTKSIFLLISVLILLGLGIFIFLKPSERN